MPAVLQILRRSPEARSGRPLLPDSELRLAAWLSRMHARQERHTFHKERSFKGETMRTRAEHLQFCKDRAMEYVNKGDLLEGVTSMMSDLAKHPETAKSTDGALAMLGMLACQQAQRGDREGVVRYITGFN
jgi:hypothetical protein